MSEVLSETRKMVPLDRMVTSTLVPVLLDAEGERCGGVLFKETVQLAHLLLRVLVD